MDRPSTSLARRLAPALLPAVAAVALTGLVPPPAAAQERTDWSRPETIEPRRGSLSDFLDTDLVAYDRAASAAYDAGRFEDAARLYLFILRQRSDDARVIYNLACCYGRMGEAELAARTLRRALGAGFVDVATFKADRDFDRVRDHEAFAPVRDAVLAWGALLGEEVLVESRQLARCRVLMPASAGQRPPLVVLAHGRGGSVEDAMTWWAPVRNQGVAVAAPEAPYRLPPGIDSKRPQFSWGVPSRDEAVATAADALVVDYLTRVAGTVSRQRGTGQSYLLGHSQGGAYAFLAAFQHPEVFSGVVVFAGVFPEERLSPAVLENARGKVRVFLAHGDLDKAVPQERSAQARARLAELGFDVTYLPFEGDHRVAPHALAKAVEWIKAGPASEGGAR